MITLIYTKSDAEGLYLFKYKFTKYFRDAIIFKNAHFKLSNGRKTNLFYALNLVLRFYLPSVKWLLVARRDQP